jgi:hypothetical protein
MKLLLDKFSGVNTSKDSSDKWTWRALEGIVLRPGGAFIRAPVFWRLWDMYSLNFYQESHYFGIDDKTILLMVHNEGHFFLVFYDATNNLTLGIFYAGRDNNPASVVLQPTLTLTNPTIQVLKKGLAAKCRWDGYTDGNKIFMGNGVDQNLVYDGVTGTLRNQGDELRPLSATLAAIAVERGVSSQAILSAGDLLFTAAESLTGEEGNYLKVSIAEWGKTTLDSKVTGKGKPHSSYHYQILIPAGATCENVVEFVKRDSNNFGLVTVETTDGGEDAPKFQPAALAGGVSYTPPKPFTQNSAVCVLTYFRRTGEETGIESGASMFSEEVNPLDGHLFVAITKDETAVDAADYDTIKIYIAVNTHEDEADPGTFKGAFVLAREVPNETATYVITPADLQLDKLMKQETFEPAPARFFDKVDNRLLMAGNGVSPLRVQFGRRSSREEPSPEGVGLFSYNDVQAVGPESGLGLTALRKYLSSAVAFTRDGAYVGNVGEDQEKKGSRRFLQMSGTEAIAGALNNLVVETYNDVLYYLGSDFNLYKLAPRPQSNTIDKTPVGKLAAEGVADYLKRFCDTTDDLTACGSIDHTNGQWWLWVRGRGGNMLCFCWDFEQRALTGPIELPGLVTVCRIGLKDARFIGGDLHGNLFVIDLSPRTTIEDAFTNGGALTIRPSASVPATFEKYDGFGIVTIPNGVSAGVNGYVTKGNVGRLLSGKFHFGDPTRTDFITGLTWTQYEGSAGIVCFRFTNEVGQHSERYIGEINGRARGISNLNFAGKSFQLEWQVVFGDDKPFGARDLTIHYEKGK